MDKSNIYLDGRERLIVFSAVFSRNAACRSSLAFVSETHPPLPGLFKYFNVGLRATLKTKHFQYQHAVDVRIRRSRLFDWYYHLSTRSAFSGNQLLMYIRTLKVGGKGREQILNEASGISAIQLISKGCSPPPSHLQLNFF